MKNEYTEQAKKFLQDAGIGHHCRELYNISKEEYKIFSERLGEK